MPIKLNGTAPRACAMVRGWKWRRLEPRERLNWLCVVTLNRVSVKRDQQCAFELDNFILINPLFLHQETKNDNAMPCVAKLLKFYLTSIFSTIHFVVSSSSKPQTLKLFPRYKAHLPLSFWESYGFGSGSKTDSSSRSCSFKVASVKVKRCECAVLMTNLAFPIKVCI